MLRVGDFASTPHLDVVLFLFSLFSSCFSFLFFFFFFYTESLGFLLQREFKGSLTRSGEGGPSDELYLYHVNRREGTGAGSGLRDGSEGLGGGGGGRGREARCGGEGVESALDRRKRCGASCPFPAGRTWNPVNAKARMSSIIHHPSSIVCGGSESGWLAASTSLAGWQGGGQGEPRAATGAKVPLSIHCRWLPLRMATCRTVQLGIGLPWDKRWARPGAGCGVLIHCVFGSGVRAGYMPRGYPGRGPGRKETPESN